MVFTPKEQANELLNQLLAKITAHFPTTEAEQISQIAQHFFEFSNPEDLLEYSELADLYAAVLHYWRFVRQVPPHSCKINVSNPQVERDGWQAKHTIISVIAPDMPFLVDTIRLTVNRLGLNVYMVLHPVLYTKRDAEGVLEAVQTVDVAQGIECTLEGACSEAMIHVEVEQQTSITVLSKLHNELTKGLNDLQVAVNDWQAMRQQMEQVVTELAQLPASVVTPQNEEIAAFLHWILDNHFIFLGYRNYDLHQNNTELNLHVVPDSGLGILHHVDHQVSHSFATLPDHTRAQAQQPDLLILTKSTARATVHRPSHMDYIGVRRFDAEGQVIGEHRFLGLYTSPTYHTSIMHIPLLRQKAAYVVDKAGYGYHSHRGKSLVNILESYPRDELFQIESEQLFNIAKGILNLQEHQRVRLFIRRDPYGRFFSCLVFVPREHYDSEIRQKIQTVLLNALDGESIVFNVALSELPLAQVHFTVYTRKGSDADYNVTQIEQHLRDVTREWVDMLREAMLEQLGEERGSHLFRLYQHAFPLGYCEDFTPRQAVVDVTNMEPLHDEAGLTMRLYHPLESLDNTLHFKLFHQNHHIALSDVLPMLENLGVKVLNERSHLIQAEHRASVWMQEFGLQPRDPNLAVDSMSVEQQDAFQALFSQVWHGVVENDGFNRLVLRAELNWREIVVFRAYCRYLRQTGSNFSQDYMERTLAQNPAVTRTLLQLFYARCNPLPSTPRKEEELRARLDEQLDAVSSLDEDRILRLFLGVISATLRTNYFQRDAQGEHKPYVAFKFDPSQVPDLPEPRPLYEIFVYSPRVEGVHLRGGAVARGGLRWSDRYEDFRTEVLGLVKAQMVKNAIIVPHGSKGGFVAKHLPMGEGREAILKEAIACYQTFIRGLLDLTDNLVNGEVVPPRDVLRHDGDDPYLVVAADKGTATFSDIANGIAAEYNYWLGDAFASGGSVGYDHKKMGITARGAWESVKRYFRHLGIDTQKQDFTVVGIGDMAGDVFGNGMLLSPHIRLLAAFNHLHIFLDPNPDAASSYEERKRLFELPRSSWADYNPNLCSKGGGVFERSRKSIPLSPEVRAMLGVKEASMTPNTLINALLRAPVDLLWNGGIGTYVKAESESHAEVGDHANDTLRVNGNQLRCKVVGEGGNLGFTQLGRIEYARNGGLLNTDAIDNAGGVNCSDHEVNIKILLNQVVAAQDMTQKQRNQLLEDMTEAVAHLVLRGNYLQTQAISIANAQAAALLDVHTRMIHQLERHGRLDRALEFLPSDKHIAERRANQQGLTAPEIAVLLPYSKLDLYDALLATDLPDEAAYFPILNAYFPAPLPARFATQLHEHRLRREIIATYLTNMVINYQGGTFVYILSEETGASAADIVRAFTIAWRIFAVADWWQAVEALDNQVSAQVQIDMMLELRKLVERAARWLLRNRRLPLDTEDNVQRLQGGVMQLADDLLDLLADSEREAIQANAAKLEEQAVPAALANRIASLVSWLSALDIVEAATETQVELVHAASVHFLLGTRLRLHWLRDHISTLARDNRWNALSRSALRDELYRVHRQLTIGVLQTEGEFTDVNAQIDAWQAARMHNVDRCEQIFADLNAVAQPDLAMLSVAVREVTYLV